MRMPPSASRAPKLVPLLWIANLYIIRHINCQ
jgi:hypothetical protein